MALKHLFGSQGGREILLCTITKPGKFRPGMVRKEGFHAYSMQFIFLIIRLVPGNVVLVAIDMCGKRWNMELHENMY